MTLIQLVQQACREMALAVPNAVATSSDQQVQQMYGLMNALGQELTEMEHDWQHLIEFHTFTTDATGTSALPTDMQRPINGTWWDRTQNWKLHEARLPQGWRWLNESSLANTAPVASVRIAANALQYYPTTNTGNSFGFDYIRNTWAIDADTSAEKSAFSKDGDTCVFRDRLMVNGLKLKFFEAKGFDTAIATRDFARSLESAMGEQGAPTLSITGNGTRARLLNYDNVPDTGFGS